MLGRHDISSVTDSKATRQLQQKCNNSHNFTSFATLQQLYQCMNAASRSSIIDEVGILTQIAALRHP
jgi:hypothetical protein